MIDFNKIGNRIKEERKYILKISQEKMAEDLGMYQADISNMEKAKSGSGITDLAKLDLISDYFNIPLATLLFGQEDKNMLRYHGDQMKLKQSKKKMLKSHKKILWGLMGVPDEATPDFYTYECGPYTLYTAVERQIEWASGNPLPTGEPDDPNFFLAKFHTYVFFESELIGVMVADLTTVMQHVYQPTLKKLQTMIQGDVLDVTDVLRTLNPYWALWMFSEDENAYFEEMVGRMDEIRQTGEDRNIVYVESIYVREDCRNHGIFRMYIDLLKDMFKDCIIWLNMEPTSGSELEDEYSYFPSYSVSELGQLSMNASIAEKVGFTVDPDTWHRKAERIDEEGNLTVETVLVRKCAYYLPKDIRNLLKNDGDLVAKGRALQRVKQEYKEDEEGGMMDLHHGYVGENLAAELKISFPSEDYFYATAIAGVDNRRYIISYGSLLRDKDERIKEEYNSLEEAETSEFFDDLKTADTFLTIALMGNDESIEAGEETEDFDLLDESPYTFSDDDGSVFAEALEVKMRRTNTEKEGEILYAFVQVLTNGETYYALNRRSLQDIDQSNPDVIGQLEPVLEIDNENDLCKSKYCPVFRTIKEHM